MDISANKKESQKGIIKMIIPIAIQQLMLAIVSASDAIMLGFLNQTALSAVSLAIKVQFIFSLLVICAVEAAGMMIAQYHGSGDKSGINKLSHMAMTLSIVVGVVFTLSATFVPQWIMRIFTNDGALVEAGAEYLRYVALSYLLYGVSQTYLSLLKNIGFSKLSSRISSFTVGVNIICDVLLIFGLLGFPRLEIKGTAIGTVIARALELILAVYFLAKKEKAYKFFKFEFDRVLLKKLFKYYLIFLGSGIVWGVGDTMYSIIFGHLGSDVVAANSYASIVRNLMFCFSRGLSIGVAIILGNFLGANKLDEAKTMSKYLIKLSVIFGVISAVLIGILAPFASKFSPISDKAQEFMLTMLIISIPYIISKSVNCTMLNGIMGAGGEMMVDVYSNIFSMWLFTIPLGFLVAFVFDAPLWVVYLIVCLDETVKIPYVIKQYKSNRWVKNITK